MNLSIQDSAKPIPEFDFFNSGFRPFFLLASVFSLISIIIWGGIFLYGWPILSMPFTTLHWHAHEMIFGYGMAVAAGFLLTAVRNWTNLETLQGYSLAVLSALWLAARVSVWIIPGQILPMLICDLLFDIWLIVGVLRPILRAKQYGQFGIVSKLVLLMFANLCFYLGVLGVFEEGIFWGLHSGLYVLLALVFSMARRVMPFFIERGVGYPVKLTNRVWIDRSSLYLFLLFMIADVFWRNIPVAATLAAMLFTIHAIRLAGWYTKGIWNKPLLWVLYIGYSGAIFGFLLKVLTPFYFIVPSLPLHAFALGGIAMITVGMMARISLAHTGRDIQKHSRLLAPAFFSMFAAFVARVLLPLIAPAHYLIWLGIAQVAWSVAFALLAWVYAPILIKPHAAGT